MDRSYVFRMPERDDLVVGAALAFVTIAAWIDLAIMAADMDAATRPVAWTGRYFAAMLAMWVVMMAGMMVPSVSPAVRLYDALQRGRPGGARGSVPFFVVGYLLTWSAFSVAATALQWALSEAALLSPSLRSSAPALSAATFIVAGLFQFSGAKRACLAQCRSPAQFLVRHWRNGRLGAIRVGALHGAYCVGCCWALMALLFVFGVMNLLWVAAIAALVLAEKVMPARARLPAWGGAAMLVMGFLLFNS